MANKERNSLELPEATRNGGQPYVSSVLPHHDFIFPTHSIYNGERVCGPRSVASETKRRRGFPGANVQISGCVFVLRGVGVSFAGAGPKRAHYFSGAPRGQGFG